MLIAAPYPDKANFPNLEFTPPSWNAFILAGVVLSQGALGMVQYWTGVPEVLVSVHVLGAGAVVVATAALWVASRSRGPVPAEPDATTHERLDLADQAV